VVERIELEVEERTICCRQGSSESPVGASCAIKVLSERRSLSVSEFAKKRCKRSGETEHGLKFAALASGLSLT
jgi:hypothetical protein